MPFRILNDDQKFRRWSWISYQFTKSEGDPRLESQKVVPESLQVGGELRKGERAEFLAPLVRGSFGEANDRRESLTLVRPKRIEIIATQKSQAELELEAQKHRELANQLSFFDQTAEPLRPCRMHFRARWLDQDGKERNHECDDWETSAAFNRFEAGYGSNQAVQFIKQKFEEQYFNAGLVAAFSTHSRRNVEFGMANQWLLVGLIRLDETSQSSFLL